MSPEQLPGVKKKSFLLPYNGGEIWFEGEEHILPEKDLNLLRDYLLGEIKA